jgi:hypothetical protein
LPTPYRDNSPTNPNPSSHPSRQQPLVFHSFTHTDYLTPFTSSTRPSYSDDNDDDDDDDDVPLAHFLASPHDAPPAYTTVVRQLYRETLQQHLPRHPMVVDIDEEIALERIRADDVRFSVEKAVAMAVVIALLVLTGLLLGLLFIRH